MKMQTYKKKTTYMPREKLEDKGPEALRDEELLAILLRTGCKGKDVMSLSRSILKKYPLDKLLALTHEELVSIKGLGKAKTSGITASFELAKRALKQELDVLPVISSPRDLLPLLADLKNKKKEYFKAYFLNARNQLIHSETVSIGHLSGSLVHPREVFTPALTRNAAAVIVAHNHPSGDPSPSREDVEVTERLVEAGKIMGIELVDHILVGKENIYSMKQHGRISK
ncbi:MAG: DNA repair protein RadC [Candidatus Theseobacter exili]|nr:DNA repair protein RadC [Candidatus Theseobacter exili]